MSGREHLAEEQSRAVCQMNNDCARYSMCQLSNGCRCQSWGKCELVRIAGQPCISDPQCAVGLVCRESSPSTNSRCVPNTRLEDLPRFADLPETDMDTPPDIEPSFSGPLLVSCITLSLVAICLFLACYCRLTGPSNGTSESVDVEMNSPSSVLVETDNSQRLPTYASTDHHPSPLHHHPLPVPREH